MCTLPSKPSLDITGFGMDTDGFAIPMQQEQDYWLTLSLPQLDRNPLQFPLQYRVCERVMAAAEPPALVSELATVQCNDADAWCNKIGRNAHVPNLPPCKMTEIQKA